jgi:hypothetical protein
MIYDSSKGGNFNALRREAFKKKVNSYPKQLPPTSDAARFHSYRVFYQVQV